MQEFQTGHVRYILWQAQFSDCASHCTGIKASETCHHCPDCSVGD